MQRPHACLAVLSRCSMNRVSYVSPNGGTVQPSIKGKLTMEKSINLLDGTIVLLLGIVGFAILSTITNFA